MRGILCTLLLGLTAGAFAQEPIEMIRERLNRQDYDGAAKIAEQALAENPKDVDVMVVYGFGMLWNKDYAKAMKLFTRVLELAPDYGDAAIGLIKAYTWSEQFDKLRQFLAAQGERFKKSAYTRSEVIQAELRLELHDHPDEYTDLARKLAEAVLKDDPKNRMARGVMRGTASPAISKYIREAEQAVRDQHLADAEKLYARAVELDPLNDDVRLTYARVVSWNQKYDDALVILRAVLERAPENTDALNVQARIYAWQARPQEAEAVYRKIIGIQPDNGEAKRGLADVLRWLGKYDEALKFSSDLVAAFPDDEEVAAGHARLMGLMGRHDEAIAFLQKFLEAHPGASQARAALANEYAAAKRLTDAVNELRKSIQLDANNKNAYLSLGKLYSWQDQTNEAVSLYSSVLDRDPENVPALTGLGNTYRFAGLNGKAMAYYQQALAVDPEYTDAQEGLKMIQEATAPQARARYSFSRYDDAEPPNRPIRYKSYTEERIVDYQYHLAPDHKLLVRAIQSNLIEKDYQTGDRNYDLDRESYGFRLNQQWDPRWSSVFSLTVHEYKQDDPAFSPLRNKRRRADFYGILQHRKGPALTTLLYSQDDYITNQLTGNLKIGNIITYDISHQRDLGNGLTVVGEATAEWFNVTRLTRETFQGRATYRFKAVDGAALEGTWKHVTSPNSMIYSSRLFWARYSATARTYVYAHYKYEHENALHDSFHEGNVLYSGPAGQNAEYTVEGRYTDYFSGDQSWNAIGYLTFKY